MPRGNGRMVEHPSSCQVNVCCHGVSLTWLAWRKAHGGCSRLWKTWPMDASHLKRARKSTDGMLRILVCPTTDEHATHVDKVLSDMMQGVMEKVELAEVVVPKYPAISKEEFDTMKQMWPMKIPVFPT